jgi:hypothetical protein
MVSRPDSWSRSRFLPLPEAADVADAVAAVLLLQQLQRVVHLPLVDAAHAVEWLPLLSNRNLGKFINVQFSMLIRAEIHIPTRMRIED